MTALCGLWIDADGSARLSSEGEGGSREERRGPFRPFAWLTEGPVPANPGVEIEGLRGEGSFRSLLHASDPSSYDEALAGLAKDRVDAIRPLESQYLIQNASRLYEGLPFSRLRRMQFDIETHSAEGFSDADRAADRVLAIGTRCGGRTRLLELAAMTDDAERELLQEFNRLMAEVDPDVIEGHNCFRFDFDYLRRRCRRLRVECAWGRFGQRAAFRSGRLKLAERQVDFPRCDLPGRSIVDTYLLVQLFDLTVREMTSYGLKEAAVYFGITPEDGAGRTYIEGGRIGDAFRQDRARFRSYLEDDLRETSGIADLLLPTYFEQAKAFPLSLQDAILRGATAKIDLLMLETYYRERHACPAPAAVAPFGGGYTRSFQEGVHAKVLHFDVASLYPSLLLEIGRNPEGDRLGAFIPLLRQLREYRLRYKQLARSGTTAEERAEAQARQAAYKILINSFYGYLGFSAARFADGKLAAEVTQRGRDLLQALIARFEQIGCRILEADTDGIYLASERHYDTPERLLEQAAGVLPPGIDLEWDGRYERMFCYKAKNYALWDGRKVTVRGSALRSRGMEPFLQQLTEEMIRFLLGTQEQSPLAKARHWQKMMADRKFPVGDLAKSESLSQSPEAYEKSIAEGGKPRRPAAEAALLMARRPRMGDRVSYYIAAGRSRGPDWQRARPLELFDEKEAPYDGAYYGSKIDDWLEKYGPFLGVVRADSGVQGELL